MSIKKLNTRNKRRINYSEDEADEKYDQVSSFFFFFFFLARNENVLYFDNYIILKNMINL